MNCYGYNYYKNCYPNPLPEEQVVSRDRKVPGENKVPRENRASRETPGAPAPSVPGEWQARRAPGDPKGSGATWDRRETLAP